MTIVTDPDPSPRMPPMPPHEPASAYDPTGIDDGKGGIALGTRRPALRATAWIALVVVMVAIAALAWRTMERKAVERAYTVGVKALADGRPDDARVAFDRAIAAFSLAYADQNEKDHAALDRAVRRGKVEAVFEETG